MEINREFIKNNYVKFSLYKKGNFYYDINYEGKVYTFPIPLEDVKNDVMTRFISAYTVIKYMRQAITDGKFVEKKGI